MNITLRLAKPKDAARLVEIYRPYVENTTVSFEYQAPDTDEFRRRMCKFSEDFPYLVCECEGIVVGYAYAHQFKERYAYRFAAELSIYLDINFRGKGIGKKLYGALIELLCEMGYTNVYGLVTSENVESFAFHKHFGFSEVGRENLVGYKFGRWLDVIIYEKHIGKHISGGCPTAWNECPSSVNQLGVKLGEILKKYEKS